MTLRIIWFFILIDAIIGKFQGLRSSVTLNSVLSNQNNKPEKTIYLYVFNPDFKKYILSHSVLANGITRTAAVAFFKL